MMTIDIQEFVNFVLGELKTKLFIATQTHILVIMISTVNIFVIINCIIHQTKLKQMVQIL